MKADFVDGNALTLLESGVEYFPALQEAIAAAQREIHVESYIFADDETGRAIAAALCRAARRGVAVRVLVDGFGGSGFATGLGRAMLADGVDVMIFRPERKAFSFRRHRLRRLHRKLVVVDGSVAFVGGINIIDDMDTPHQVPPRLDYAVRVTGPLVSAIHLAVHRLWWLMRWASFRRRERWTRDLPVPAPTGEVAAALVVRDNFRHRRDIEEAYLEAIAAARSEVILANAYFLPGKRFRHALMDAARRGVRVVVMVQGRVEYLLLRFATPALYGSLVSAGVRIAEYHRSFLHAKVAVIDGSWATVGSSNIDPFSLLLAREANLVIRNRPFAGDLRDRLERAIAEGARIVDAAELRRRPLYLRIANWLAYGLVRLAIGLAGYGGKQYQA